MTDPENLPLGDALDIARAGFDHVGCPDEWLDCNAARTLAGQYLREHPEGEEPPAPHDVLPLQDQAIATWRAWAIRQVEGGTYGPNRVQTVNAIFDAAVVGMKQVRSDEAAFRRSYAEHLRHMADQIERSAK